MTEAPGKGFRPIGALDEEALIQRLPRFGPDAVRMVVWLRGHGGVRTLAEIAAALERRAEGLVPQIAALERVAVIHRRDMIIGGGSVPVFWAPGVVGAMPWTEIDNQRGVA